MAKYPSRSVNLEDCTFSIMKNDRTNLAKQLEAWVGRTNSGVALQNVEFSYWPDPNGPYAKYRKDTGGLVRVIKHRFERDDIFVLQFWDGNKDIVGNVFIETSGIYSNQIDGCTYEEKQLISKKVKEVLEDPANQEFITHQQKWFNEKPWEQIDQLTPEQAIAKLIELGWTPRTF